LDGSFDCTLTGKKKGDDDGSGDDFFRRKAWAVMRAPMTKAKRPENSVVKPEALYKKTFDR